jgi:WXG100 family type VII secretion target
MVTYSVNMSAVQDIASEMGSIASGIKSMLDELDSSTAQNLAEWTSAARDAYNQARQVWDQAAADMVLQAGNAQSSLSQINENYAQAESKGLGLWGS